MTIYDRWGEQLYFTRNIEVGWNGYFKGRKVPIGVYCYIINYVDNNNDAQNIVGKVTIVR